MEYMHRPAGPPPHQITPSRLLTSRQCAKRWNSQCCQMVWAAVRSRSQWHGIVRGRSRPSGMVMPVGGEGQEGRQVAVAIGGTEWQACRQEGH